MSVTVAESTQLGLERHVDIGLRLRATRETAAATARSVGAIIDEFPSVGVRLAGIDREKDVVDVTVVVTLGTVDQVAACDESARDAVALLHRLTTDLAAHEPSLCMIPDPQSRGSFLAKSVA